MHMLAVLLIGYALLSAPVIALTHFRPRNYPEQGGSRLAGLVVLASLFALQVCHLLYLEFGYAAVDSVVYRMLLFAVAPAFYLFSRPLLRATEGLRLTDLLHIAPVIGAPWLPFAWALPLAFLLGAGYLLWLARTVHALAAERARFRLELAMLGAVFVIAIAVAVLGVGSPLLEREAFFALYAVAIGGAFLLVNVVLGLAPALSGEVAEVARERYAVSTLGQVDCPAVLARLERLMREEQLYQHSDLGLLGLAERLELSAHQLSELLNTRLGKSFSRYLREVRVEAARHLLTADPRASVLSVGMSVGFGSQSAFYEAFREITGMTPAKYRRTQAPPPGLTMPD